MVKAAARELVREVATRKDTDAGLLPPIADARRLSRSIGQAVGREAIADGVAQVTSEDALNRELEANIWKPVYRVHGLCFEAALYPAELPAFALAQLLQLAVEAVSMCESPDLFQK